MTANQHDEGDRGWVDASGLRQILRTLRLAVHPTKLGLALMGIFLTLVWGGLLDRGWRAASDGISESTIAQFIHAKQFDQPFEEENGNHAVFQLWWSHEKRAVLDLLGSSLPGASVAAGTPVGSYLEVHSRAQPLRNLAEMVYGVWWLIRHHTLFAVILGVGVLLIWSLAGGAICRVTAIEMARDERLSMTQALSYSREKLFGGFFLAPCIPIGIILATMGLLIAGGMALRIPFLGDLVGGVAFGFAILGGFAMTTLALGLIVGGSLFWPAVAVEGSDAFDAFSRGISYPVARPWKFFLYVVMSVIYAGYCWLFVNFFTFYVLKITRATVGIGASWFGWWGRGPEGESVSKIDVLWPLTDVNSLYARPEWSQLAWYEWFSAALIGFYVLVAIGLMWSFLASFYYTGSTVIYFLLRRDVDETDMDDVYSDDEDASGMSTTGRGSTLETSPAPTSGITTTTASGSASPSAGETREDVEP